MILVYLNAFYANCLACRTNDAGYLMLTHQTKCGLNLIMEKSSTFFFSRWNYTLIIYSGISILRISSVSIRWHDACLVYFSFFHFSFIFSLSIYPLLSSFSATFLSLHCLSIQIRRIHWKVLFYDRIRCFNFERAISSKMLLFIDKGYNKTTASLQPKTELFIWFWHKFHLLCSHFVHKTICKCKFHCISAQKLFALNSLERFLFIHFWAFLNSSHNKEQTICNLQHEFTIKNIELIRKICN